MNPIRILPDDIVDVSKLTKLGSPLAIHRHARPVIRPSLVPPTSQRNHRLNRKAHSWLASSYGLVLCIMGDVWCTMKELVDAVTAICLDNTEVLGFGMLFYYISEISEKCARLDCLDC